VAYADDVCPHGLRRGRHHDVEGRCDAMLARWSTPFCSGDGRQAGLLYLAAGYRDTTLGRHRTLHAVVSRPSVGQQRASAKRGFSSGIAGQLHDALA
jgi:hypothetical protein